MIKFYGNMNMDEVKATVVDKFKHSIDASKLLSLGKLVIVCESQCVSTVCMWSVHVCVCSSAYMLCVYFDAICTLLLLCY